MTGAVTMRVEDACAEHWDAFKGDCSGFARAVARDLGVTLAGDANALADLIAAAKGGGWRRLDDGPAAAKAAATGELVLVGLRGDAQAHPSAHGHVCVVVPGELARGRYPTAWWGSLGGTPAKRQTINFAWNTQDRDKVAYAAHPLP